MQRALPSLKTKNFRHRWLPALVYSTRMQVVIVLCHPFERSFCHALAETAEAASRAAGGEPTVHDLYAEGADPVLTGAEIARRFSLDDQIQGYSSEIAAANTLIVIHPDWWSSPPAVLKGWMERVLRPGVAYDWQGEEFEENEYLPTLTHVHLKAPVTTAKRPEALPEAISLFWKDACSYSGMQDNGVRFFADMRHSSHRQRRAWLKETEEEVTALCSAT